MPNQAARIASVIFVNLVAALPLATMARGETAAPDTCLSAPKGAAPAGSHWRYHVDHVNKRNCWYLRLGDGSVSQVAPQNSITAPPPPATPSVADAYAELRPQDKTVADPPASRAATPASNGAGEGGSPSTSIWNAAPPATTPAPAEAAAAPPAVAAIPPIATRWPDVPTTSPVQNTAAAPSAPANDGPQASDDPVLTAAPSAAAANLSASIEPETIRTLIAGMLGALAFAGAAALTARRRGLGRHLRRRVGQSSRGPISETTDDDRIILSDHPYPDQRDYRPRFARGAGAAAASGGRKLKTARRAPRYAQR